MDATRSAVVEIDGLHEGSWAYLGLGRPDPRDFPDLRREVIAACAASGLPGISWSPPPHRRHDPARYIAGMSDAIEHADVVIVLLDGDSSTIEGELVLAIEHRRPVIGLGFAGETSQRSAVRAMARSYERFRSVEGEDVASCANGLREALTDPAFVAILDEAAGEAVAHA